jgi:diaminopimelate epimerase
MLIKFTKMHGLGNDFVVIDAVRQHINLTTEAIKKMADRNVGIGCDQVLILEPPADKNSDFNYRIFNCDGTEVEQCGNGARCMGRYIADQQLSGKQTVLLQTKNRVMEVSIKPKNLVTANMGAPLFKPPEIPFISDQEEKLYPIETDTERYEIAAISVGNPHAVIQVEDVDTTAVSNIGPQIQAHNKFPESVNVGFMQIIDRQTIKLRVYERGVGETQACGSGACAAAVAAIQQNLVDSKVKIELVGGVLWVEWQGNDQPILMTGPAETVFHGKINL